jgi:hypothetical protein
MKNLPRLAQFAFPLLALSFAISGCGKFKDLFGGDSGDTGAESAATTGVSAISGAMMSVNTNVSPAGLGARVGTPTTSQAAIDPRCTTPIVDTTCLESTHQEVIFPAACPLDGSTSTFTGVTRLDYTTAGCRFTTSDVDSITRTLKMVRTLDQGVTITTTSENLPIYRDNVIIGGGTLMQKTDNGATLHIVGLHKTKRNSDGAEISNVTIKTASGILTSNPTQPIINISTGLVNVYHNTAGYTAAMTLTGLRTDSRTCCYPTAGSIQIKYSGSLNGDARISFDQPCGSATFTRDGTPHVIAFTGCE